jgi:hypothetical protein
VQHTVGRPLEAAPTDLLPSMPRPKASVTASRINGGKASNKGVAKSKVKVLEVTSHGGKRVVEHVELPKLPKGYGAYFTELAARRRAEQAAMLLDDIKNAPEDKKLLESAQGMLWTPKMLRASSALSSRSRGRKSPSREMSRTHRMRSGRVQAL